MWWIAFTAIDLYLGLIVIDVLARSESLSPQKLRRLAVVKKVVIAAISVLAVVFVVKLLR